MPMQGRQRCESESAANERNVMKMLFAIIIAIFGVPMAIATAGSGSGIFAALAGCCAALAPLALTLRSRAASARDDQRLLAAAREAVGAAPGMQFEHVEVGTAIVLDPESRRLAVAQGARSKVYRYEDVRSWRAHKESAAGSMGGGVGTIAAGSASIAASKQADLNTGLFLTMRDIDNPEWRVSMFEASDRARWSEILRQEIDERAA
jgi:hypothetical protein